MELVIRKQIIKGKRTKRKRSRSSPIPISISMANCSSSGEGGGGYGDNDVNTATATTTTPCPEIQTEMIRKKSRPNSQVNNVWIDRQSVVVVEERLGWWCIGARHVIEPFLRFVRWGGHTTSHTRPKPQMASCDNPKASSKVHECPICGAGFSSGQALGGHMTRHRGSVGTSNPRLSSGSNGFEFQDQEAKKGRIVLPLDLGLGLNLSAPKDIVFWGPTKTSPPSNKIISNNNHLLCYQSPSLWRIVTRTMFCKSINLRMG
ncbi:hypothetical protein Acr_02g0011900 [Actinidia rufa]|uniref:C2H2-type domain-containing protein n=1 Tax=Actinidia rufa TaxID=165716 RepID=A0A7J0E974_9ERIC|nr:hypothetical protein Acr_02g0011900 [Actinidia rufa]